MPESGKSGSRSSSRRSVAKGEPAALPDRNQLAKFMAKTGTRRLQTVLYEAQQLVYDAWEAPGAAQRLDLARKALGICPVCADAWSLLARENAASREEALDYYGLAVEAGQMALGPEEFEDCAGHFWGFFETRPYMRARQGLALTLWTLGKREEAVSHYRAMLDLNPDDNQGIRYVLADCLLELDDRAGLEALFAQYEDEGSALLLYTRALAAYRAGDGQAETIAKAALKSNAHVPAILAGSAKPVPVGGYIQVGGKDEASAYVERNREEWIKTPGAVEWLLQIDGKAGRRDKKTGA